MRLLELRKVNIATAIFGLLLNIFYFLPISISIIKTDGGPFGFGFILLFITLPINLLIIPNICIFLPKWKYSDSLIYLNFFALIFQIICFGFLKCISGL